MTARNPFPYVYNPGLLDRFDPIVISGQPIRSGSIVRISRKLRSKMLPPMFATVVDLDGNVMNVFRVALSRELSE